MEHTEVLNIVFDGTSIDLARQLIKAIPMEALRQLANYLLVASDKTVLGDYVI